MTLASRSDYTLGHEVAAALAQAVRPHELGTEEREHLRTRILRRVAAAPPAGMLTIRANEGSWQDLSPGIQIKILREESALDLRSFLVRMAPGSIVARHAHAREEHCLVLEGEVLVGEHTMRAGDWHVALPGSVHEGFRTKTGCLLFIRAELPKHV